MRKALKIALWTACAALLLAAAAALALKLYFTPERLKALALDYTARNLGREAAFDSAALDLSGLSLHNFRLSEYPDFKKGEFLSAETFSVRPSLRALLRREIKINSISVSGLKMRVTETRKDTYNFSDLLKPGAKPPEEKRPGKETAVPPLAISRLKVRDSGFTYVNAAGDMTVELRDISFSASGISADALFPLESGFTLKMTSPYFTGTIPVQLKGRVALGGWNPEKGKAEIDKLSLSLGGVKGELKGSLSNLLEPDAKLSASIKAFSTSDLKGIVKGLPSKLLLPEVDLDADFKATPRDLKLRSAAFRAGPLKGSLKGTAAWGKRLTYDLSADLSLQTPELDTGDLAKKLRQPAIPRGIKLPLAEIRAAVRLRDGTAQVSAFSLDCAAASISGRSSINFGGPSLKASGPVKVEIKNLSKLAAIAPALLGEYALSGSASAQLDYSYSAQSSVSGHAVFSGIGASFSGHALSSAAGALDFTKDSIACGELEGKLDGEDLKGSFQVKDLTGHPKAAFELKLAKLVLRDAPPAPPAAPKKGAAKAAAPAGQFSFDLAGRAEAGAIEHPNLKCGPASLKLELTGISEDLKALGGSASFTAGPGKFSELLALAGRYKAAKVVLYPFVILQKSSKLAKGLNLPDFNDIAFDKMEGDYTFDKGVMTLDKSSLTAAVADVSSSGTIDLPAEKQDMKITTRLKEASGVKMTAPVAMLVKGTFASPSVKVDMKSVMEQPVVKKGLDKAVKEGSKFLKGLLKK